MILYPAFRIQQSMMLSTMGIDWWTSRRAALADGRKKERRDSDREVARRKKHAAKMKKREELRAKYDLAGGMWAYRFQEAARDASTASSYRHFPPWFQRLAIGPDCRRRDVRLM